MTSSQMKARIESLAPGTSAELVDLTGTQDHWQATVVSAAFNGVSRIDRHRMVFDLFKAEVDSNEVHALTIRTYTPDEAAKK